MSINPAAIEDSPVEPPKAQFQYLETLWFQISGTLCNLRCTHCFISCSPDNHTLEMMDSREIFRYLDQAKVLGVKEIYYTGGEPFIHKEIMVILERTLDDFPASVLTNGLPINENRADQLKEISENSRYSLEIRISLDDYHEERNNAVRGRGTFRQALAAYKRLYERDFLPILTVSEIRDYLYPRENDLNVYQKYVELLQSIGVDRPRIKIIPVFEMGMLPTPKSMRHVSYDMMKDYDHSLLQCSSSRMVAHNGIYACPILVGQAGARMGTDSLGEALQPCSLYHTSCHTCYTTGMTCKNF
ncbi:radical SAM protein [Acidobacteria bacterium AH-259-L09]|nr:radical SAM protein [Acidobacteria bacterium AH-259-L09]